MPRPNEMLPPEPADLNDDLEAQMNAMAGIDNFQEKRDGPPPEPEAMDDDAPEPAETDDPEFDTDEGDSGDEPEALSDDGEQEPEADDTDPETEDEPDETPDEPEPKAKSKKVDVPEGRFKKVVAERNGLKAERDAIQAELKALKEKAAKAGDSQAEMVDFADAYKELADKIIDNDPDGAKGFNDLMNKAIQMGAERGMKQALEKFDERYLAKTSQRDFDTVVGELESAYPVFNGKHEAFDEQFTKRVGMTARMYQQEGMHPAEALETAAQELMEVYHPELLQEQEPTRIPAARDQTRQRQTSTAVRQKTKAANLQPPKIGGRRDPSQRDDAQRSKIDWEHMSPEQFNDIPPDELERMLFDSM